MHKQHSNARIIALLLGAGALLMTGFVSADPPTRVARLGYASGAVSFSPGGEDDWVQATINRPLITGDRLWVDAGARAELQVGSATIRMNEGTSVTLLNLDDRVTQVQLAQGTLNIRVRRFDSNDVFEIDTPNLAYSIRRPGEYRIDVNPAGNTTTVVVRDGQAEVFGDGAAYIVNARQAYRFYGSDMRDYEYIDAPRADEFDRWASERDRRGAVSARYVSRDVIGYEDLDDYGSWRSAEGYGHVWVPTRVAVGWSPYHDGHWAWVDPWGWTWVDDAPWGFAVSHYGRWVHFSGSWGWVPGPIRARPVYAPALVAFVGGSNFQLSISIGNVAGVAWFPLGPRDVYRPSYPVSRGYFNNINTSNTTINTINITNVYNNVNVRNITYANQHVPNAIVAVPSAAFVQSQPVGRTAVRLSREAIAKAPVMAVAEVAPTRTSVRGAAEAGRQPPAEALKRPVVARSAPPSAPVPFAAKEPALAAHPGRPLDAAALKDVKPAARAPAPSVRVVSPTQRAVAPPKQKTETPQRAPETTKRPQSPETQKQPQRPEMQKAPQPPASAPRSSEVQRGAPPSEVKKEQRAREAQEAPQSPEVRKTPQPPVSAPRPPESQKAPQPSETQRRAQPQPEPQKVPQPPASVPRSMETQRVSPPKSEDAKAAEKREAKQKQSDEQLKREEEEKSRKP